MLILARPKTGRIVTGVALGISELYGVPVSLIRIALVAAMIASPISALFYLLLSISIPNEGGVVGSLTIEGLDAPMLPRDRFTRFSQILIKRLISPDSNYAIPANVVSIALLAIAVLLELPKIEGAQYYYYHPVLTVLLSDISRIATALFYVAIAAVILAMRSREHLMVSIDLPPSEKFSLDSGVRKMIGGLAAGISSVVKIDPAYIRTLLLLLNMVTFGIIGVIYFVVQYLLRRKEKQAAPIAVAQFLRLPEEVLAGYVQHKRGETSPLRLNKAVLFRSVLALLFLALAAIRITTEFRLFFFNEPFMQGLVILLAGLSIAWRGTASGSRSNNYSVASIALLAGSSMFFAGTYFLATAIGRIQITYGQNIEIAEIVAAISLAYFGVVALTGAGRRAAFLLAGVIGLSAASVGLHFAPLHDLATIGQFYDFFYPVIFGVLGFWIAFEK